MEREAIEKIVELVNAAKFDLTLEKTPAIVIPEKTKIETIEHLLENPAHFKAHFQTNLLATFIEYCADNESDDCAIFIDPEKMTALSIFDMGSQSDPKWGKHRATLALEKTPAFSSIIKNDRNGFDQQSFIDFLNDWDEYIKFFDENDDEIEFKNAINRIRRLTVNSLKKSDSEIGNFKSEATAMESVEVLLGNDKPPAKILFYIDPYLGFSTLKLTLEIRAVVKNDGISLHYRISGLESVKDHLSHEFKERLTPNLPKTKIYIGNVAYQ